MTPPPAPVTPPPRNGVRRKDDGVVVTRSTSAERLGISRAPAEKTYRSRTSPPTPSREETGTPGKGTMGVGLTLQGQRVRPAEKYGSRVLNPPEIPLPRGPTTELPVRERWGGVNDLDLEANELDMARNFLGEDLYPPAQPGGRLCEDPNRLKDQRDFSLSLTRPVAKSRKTRIFEGSAPRPA